MKLKYTATKEIEKNIKSLKSKNSHGYDEIPMKILEVNGSVLGSFLLYINYFLNIAGKALVAMKCTLLDIIVIKYIRICVG